MPSRQHSFLCAQQWYRPKPEDMDYIINATMNRYVFFDFILLFIWSLCLYNSDKCMRAQWKALPLFSNQENHKNSISTGKRNLTFEMLKTANAAEDVLDMHCREWSTLLWGLCFCAATVTSVLERFWNATKGKMWIPSVDLYEKNFLIRSNQCKETQTMEWAVSKKKKHTLNINMRHRTVFN